MCHENDHDHDVETEQNKVFQHLVLFLQDIFDKREADIAIYCPAERQLDESTWPTVGTIKIVALFTQFAWKPTPVCTGAREHDCTCYNHQARTNHGSRTHPASYVSACTMRTKLGTSSAKVPPLTGQQAQTESRRTGS